MSSPQAILIGIVVAGVLVAAAIYLRPTRTNSVAAAPSAFAPSTTSASNLQPPRVTGSPPTAISTDAARAEVQKQWEAHKAALVKQCWTPIARGDAAKDEGEFELNFGFGADGQQLSRGIVEQRQNARQGAAACLADHMPTFKISPPGTPLSFSAVVKLP